MGRPLLQLRHQRRLRQHLQHQRRQEHRRMQSRRRQLERDRMGRPLLQLRHQRRLRQHLLRQQLLPQLAHQQRQFHRRMQSRRRQLERDRMGRPILQLLLQHLQLHQQVRFLSLHLGNRLCHHRWRMSMSSLRWCWRLRCQRLHKLGQRSTTLLHRNPLHCRRSMAQCPHPMLHSSFRKLHQTCMLRLLRQG